MRAPLVLAALSISACAPNNQPVSEAPKRIVSLDYCADQYVLQFSDREDILALSPDAQKRFSYLREQASGIAQVRPRTADILTLKPDLVVRSYGGDPGIAVFLEKVGVPVVQLGYPQTLDDVREEVLRVGSRLGEAGKAQALVDEMDRRLAAVGENPKPPREVLYITPGGVSAGEQTMIDEIFQAAGTRNFLKRPGWHDVPLEQMAYDKPDMIAAAFFESDTSHTGSWSAARHPLARSQMEDLPVVTLEGAWTSCGAWFLVDAVEALANARRDQP